MLSKHVAAFFATALSNKGSNRAASISLTTIRATFVPSAEPGGILPLLNWLTVSFILFEDLVM
jgi:hypothetical protein